MVTIFIFDANHQLSSIVPTRSNFRILVSNLFKNTEFLTFLSNFDALLGGVSNPKEQSMFSKP